MLRLYVGLVRLLVWPGLLRSDLQEIKHCVDDGHY